MRPFAEIARQRRELSARSAEQRAAVALGYRRLERRLVSADRVLGLVQFVRRYPVLFGAGTALLVGLLGRKVSVLPAVGQGLLAWRILRVAGNLLLDRQRAKEGPAR
jgi:hypothetical protein